MSDLGLEGHVVLVTGALGTLGSAMCRAIRRPAAPPFAAIWLSAATPTLPSM